MLAENLFAEMQQAQYQQAAISLKNDLLSVNNIEVVYNKTVQVLRGLSLKVDKGAVVALLGSNGAGKSTTLKAISNLLEL
ncbi:ATP-binding cassette domain-containing protein, partial [Acinetobacter baumannii]